MRKDELEYVGMKRICVFRHEFRKSLLMYGWKKIQLHYTVDIVSAF